MLGEDHTSRHEPIKCQLDIIESGVVQAASFDGRRTHLLLQANRSPSISHNHQHCSIHRSWARRFRATIKAQGPTKSTRMLVYRATAERESSCAYSFSHLTNGMSVKRQCTIKRDRSQTDIKVLDEKANNIATTRARRSPHSLILIDQDHEHALPEMRFSRSNVRRASGASPQK